MKPHPHVASNPHAAWVVASLLMLSCNRVPEPDSGVEEESSEATAAASSTPSSTKADSHAAQPVGTESLGSKIGNVAPAEGGDPERGEFTLDEALAGLAGTGAPSAKLETDLGTLECKLYQDKAPIAVANFIGLARGTRPWKDPKGQWVKVPAYDGTVFHRIIKGFMIQGGDPEGTGKGGPGYVFKDEVWAGAKHDRRGLLCMANRGPNTNGAQFFILDGAAPHLDRGYTIFGECGPEAVIEKLASVPVLGERPTKAPVIKRVTITRQ